MSIADALQRYLEDTLHEPARVAALDGAPSLPSFLSRMYSLFEGRVARRRCIFLTTVDNTATPSDIAKHVALIRPAVDTIVVFVAPWLSAHNRSRLIERGVPFVVPGKQLYIPDLAMDLRERFRTPKLRSTAGLSPAAQAVLFHRLLRLDETATTPSLVAAQLHYSAMSIGRAFDDLVGAGLAQTERHGRERRIRFQTEGRQLFDAAHDLLRSPVRTEKFIRDVHATLPLKRAGESALAELTDLSPPPLPALAIAATDWKSLVQTHEFVDTDRERASHIVETWSYDPAACLPRRPWIRCRSTPSSTITAMSVYPWRRNDCWTECRGNWNRQVSRTLRSP